MHSANPNLAFGSFRVLRLALGLSCAFAWFGVSAPNLLHAQATTPSQLSPAPSRRSPPHIQIIPEPRLSASFQVDGKTILGFDSGTQGMRRPFLYPVLGPSGQSLTRMGHPHDPVSHSHHNSVWISHNNIGGIDFWSDKGGTIETLQISKIEDGDTQAWVELKAVWKAPNGVVILKEDRRITLHAFSEDRWRIDMETELSSADGQPVIAGTTAFGFLGVRVAKTIGVKDGGGTILNSEGGRNEAGCFRKPARWVDYSGPITRAQDEGITLMDHPQNHNHPTEFHVRDDGWMGAANTFRGPYRIEDNHSLRLKYGLLVHRDHLSVEILDSAWAEFSKTDFIPFAPAKK